MKYIDEIEHDGICVKIYKDNGVYVLQVFVDGVYQQLEHHTDNLADALKKADFMVHGGEL